MVNTVPSVANIGSTSGTVGLKIQLASDDTGAYVPVIALDSDVDITIGTVNQGTSPWIVQQSDNRGLNQTLNASTLNAAVTVSLQGGEGVVGWTLAGLTASGATVTFEGTNDIGAGSPTWSGINAVSGTSITATATTDGNYRVEAGGRTAVRVRVSTVGSGTITVFYSASAASSLVSLAQSLPAGSNVIGSVASAGSTGTDYSANKPTLPNVGANFGGSGPYANYVLVATVPAATRNNVDIENTSGTQVSVIRDDGTASSGSAPNNASVFALGGGAAAGAQGGSYTSTTFKGRLQIYAPSSSAQVAVMVE